MGIEHLGGIVRLRWSKYQDASGGHAHGSGETLHKWCDGYKAGLGLVTRRTATMMEFEG